MHIGLDVTPLAVPLTGIGNVVQRFAAAIADDPGFSLAPFALTGKNADRVRQNLPPGSSLPRSLPAALVHPLWRRLNLPTAHQLAGQPVDLVHGTNFYGVPGGGVPELITIHDTGPWVRPDAVSSTVRAFPRLVDRALQRGAHVHTLSFAAGEEIASLLDLPADRVHPIQIGFDHPTETPVAPSNVPVETGHRFVLTVGSIEPRKRLPQLVQTIAPLLRQERDLHLVVAGGGPDSELLDRAIARQTDVAPRIHRLGYVSEHEKSWLLRQAELVVSNSSSEGFGMVPLEAMSVQTPTVATDGAVQREVCGDAALLVPVEDPDAMASALETCLTDSAVRTRLIQAGTLQATRFSWSTTTNQLLDLYRSLAAKH